MSRTQRECNWGNQNMVKTFLQCSPDSCTVCAWLHWLTTLTICCFCLNGYLLQQSFYNEKMRKGRHARRRNAWPAHCGRNNEIHSANNYCRFQTNQFHFDQRRLVHITCTKDLPVNPPPPLLVQVILCHLQVSTVFMIVQNFVGGGDSESVPCFSWLVNWCLAPPLRGKAFLRSHKTLNSVVIMHTRRRHNEV